MTTAHPFDLSGLVAVVTGGGQALGLAMARALAEAGARVYINGRTAATLDAASKAAAADGITLIAAPFDISDGDSADAALTAIADREGRLDILVNNVGMRLRKPIEETGRDAFRAMAETNVTAPYGLARTAATLMARNGYGRIIMLSSSVAVRARAGDIAYIANKGAIESLTRGMACEWGGQNILTNAISPGPFATEANAEMASDPKFQAMVQERCPVGRWADPKEIGGACVFLASPAASFVNGVILPVDGGIAIQA